MRVNPGRFNVWATLDDPVVDGTPVTFAPARVKGQLLSSGFSGESVTEWRFVTRYHPQITFNTRITLDDGRQLFVRGIQNAGNSDRTGFVDLTLQEVLTP